MEEPRNRLPGEPKKHPLYPALENVVLLYCQKQTGARPQTSKGAVPRSGVSKHRTMDVLSSASRLVRYGAVCASKPNHRRRNRKTPQDAKHGSPTSCALNQGPGLLPGLLAEVRQPVLVPARRRVRLEQRLQDLRTPTRGIRHHLLLLWITFGHVQQVACWRVSRSSMACVVERSAQLDRKNTQQSFADQNENARGDVTRFSNSSSGNSGNRGSSTAGRPRLCRFVLALDERESTRLRRVSEL